MSNYLNFHNYEKVTLRHNSFICENFRPKLGLVRAKPKYLCVPIFCLAFSRFFNLLCTT